MLNSFQTMEGKFTEFQKTVLNSLQKQEEINNKFSGFQKTVLSSLKIINRQVGSLDTKLNFLTDRVTTLEVCMENQFTEQRVFEEKLAVVIENQIVDRISAENDVFKGYTDKKVKRHEVKFQHKAVA